MQQPILAMSYESARSDLGRPPSEISSLWQSDAEIEASYQSERVEIENTISEAVDLTVWSLEAKKDNTAVYAHCKNNEKLSFSVRSVSRVTGNVVNVVECLRSLDSNSFRTFTKMMHSKVFLDSEVLHIHQRNNREAESLAIKWTAFTTGKALAKPKEFCFREYCTILRNHRTYGTVGVVRYGSYDGPGARFGIRARSDTFSKTMFEKCSFVVLPTQEEGILTVTMTMSMRKPHGNDTVSSGVKALSLRLAQDLSYLQKTVMHAMFQPSTLATKKEWVSDHDRTNCSLCVQTFGMLKRKHHCRVCGEVVCSTCTVFKVVNGTGDEGGKIRVCKACLGRSTTTESSSNAQQAQLTTSNSFSNGKPNNQLQHQTSMSSSPYTNNPHFNKQNGNISTLSTSSTGSDDSRLGEDGEPAQLKHMQAGSYYSKASTSSSFSDYEVNPAASCSPRSNQSGGSSSIVLPPSSAARATSSRSDKRTHHFNEDFEEMCMLAMKTLNCTMAGIRTDDFELVNYFDGQLHPELPRSLPTFRRIASRGKPCIVLDVSADKRIAGEKRHSAKLQFFVGIPLIMDGEVIGDLCVADRYPRDSIDYKAVEVLIVLGKTVTQYMTSRDYIEDLAFFKTSQRQRKEQEEGIVSKVSTKEVAF